MRSDYDGGGQIMEKLTIPKVLEVEAHGLSITSSAQLNVGFILSIDFISMRSCLDAPCLGGVFVITGCPSALLGLVLFAISVAFAMQ